MCSRRQRPASPRATARRCRKDPAPSAGARRPTAPRNPPPRRAPRTRATSPLSGSRARRTKNSAASSRSAWAALPPVVIATPDSACALFRGEAISCQGGQGGARLLRRCAPRNNGMRQRSPAMTEFRYDHIHLRSPDPDATAAWYERMFGAEVKGKGVEFTVEPKTIRPGVRIAFVRGPQDVLIELLDRDVI